MAPVLPPAMRLPGRDLCWWVYPGESSSLPSLSLVLPYPETPEPGLGAPCHLGVLQPWGWLSSAAGGAEQRGRASGVLAAKAQIKDFSSVWHYPALLEKLGLLGDLSAATTSAHWCRSLPRNNLSSPAGSAELSIPCSPPHPVTEVALPKGVKDRALQDQSRNASMETLPWGSAGTAAFKRHQLFYHKPQFLIPNPNTKNQSEAH